MCKCLNKTFVSTREVHLNACVGKNGTQNLHKYAMGYREAFNGLIDLIVDNPLKCHVDTVVYPLCFLARHSIELYIKFFIDVCDRICAIKGKNTDSKFLNTHSIDLLWSTLQNRSMVDRRFKKILAVANPYVLDYSGIDDTGETFRYPYDVKYSLSLSGINIINLRIVRDRSKTLFRIFERLAYVSFAMIEEYSAGTFTDVLSRYDLGKIAQRLLDRKDWGQMKFLEEKEKIKREYELSNRQFSSALNIIQKHYKFASYIGMQIDIPGVDINSLKILALSGVEKSLKGYLHNGVVDSVVEEIMSFSDDFVCTIYAIWELGRSNWLCEDFVDMKKQYWEVSSLEGRNKFEMLDGILTRWFPIFLKKGLEIMGQTEMIQELALVNIVDGINAEDHIEYL